MEAVTRDRPPNTCPLPVATHLILFVKNPVPGDVKTRLRSRYTPAQAARIARAFLLDTLEKLRSLPVDVRTACFAPPDAGPRLRPLCPGWSLRPQEHADLGDRMYFAALAAFRAGASRVVVTGSDIPSLPAAHVSRAYDLLGDHPVVLGPSTDGGYYLVGLRRPVRAIFKGIDWSTSRVFAQTVAAVERVGLSLGLLPPWYDVDTPEELDLLAAHLRAGSGPEAPALRHTRAVLRTI